MAWQVFLLISILCESFGRILQRNVLIEDSSDPKAFAVVSNIIAVMFLFVYALSFGIKLPSNLLGLVPNLILMTIFYGSMNLFIFKALEKTEASIFIILFGSRVIIVVLLAIILLKEPFAIKQMIGTLLIIASVITMSFKKQAFKLGQGEIYSLLAGLFLALGVVNDAFILRRVDVKSYTFVGFLLPTVFMWLVSWRSTKNILGLPKKKVFPKVVLLGIIFAIAYLSYNTAYFTGHNAGQIASIFQVTSVLTVILAILLLKEKSRLFIKILAAIIGFLGVLLVS